MDMTTTPDAKQIDRGELGVAESPVVLLGDGGTYHLVISEAAWNVMNAHAHTILDREVGGILIGETFKDAADRVWLRIDAGIPALAAESRSANVTFTAEAWTRIHELIDRDHPGAKIVGWYHTHPSFGIFLSDMDVFICRHFFDMPHHVAIVIDPVADTHGAFVWRNGVPTQERLLIARPEGRPASTAPQAIDASIARAFAARPVVSFSPPRRALASLLDKLSRFTGPQWIALFALLAVTVALTALVTLLILSKSTHGT